MQMTHPKKEIQRILNRAKREGFLSSWEVDGQVIELLSLCHHLATAATQHEKSYLSSPPSRATKLWKICCKDRFRLSTKRDASPFAGDRVLHLKLHVDCHGAGVDA